MDKITVDTIIDYLKEKVEAKEAHFDTQFWIESALKLNLLLGDEHDKLVELNRKVADLKLMWLEGQDKKNVSEARLRVEASQEYEDYKKQELKCKRVEEYIKVCKKMSDRSAGY